MTDLLHSPLRKASAHLARNPHWPVIELPLLLSREFGLEPRITVDLGIACLLLYGFADITDDAQDGDLPPEWDWQRAVNAGNLLSFLGSEVLLQLPLEPSVSNRLASAYARAGRRMTFGQESDLLANYPRVPTTEEYIATITYKTGASAAFFAQAPAIASGQPESCLQELQRFGKALGGYIQVLSDLEGYDGRMGSDFKNLKVTLPLLFGLSQPDGESLRVHLEHRSAEDVSEALRRMGAPAYCRMRAELFRRHAVEALARIPISEVAQSTLLGYFEPTSRLETPYL